MSHHPFRRRQHARCKIGDAARAVVAEGGDVDSLRGRHPGHEQHQQQHAEPDHGAERRRAQHVERVPCGGLFAALAAAAQFIEADRGKRSEQGKAGGQRKQQRQYRIAEDGARQHKSEHGIDHAQDDGVAWHGLEVFPAAAAAPDGGR